MIALFEAGIDQASVVIRTNPADHTKELAVLGRIQHVPVPDALLVTMGLAGLAAECLMFRKNVTPAEFIGGFGFYEMPSPSDEALFSSLSHEDLEIKAGETLKLVRDRWRELEQIANEWQEEFIKYGEVDTHHLSPAALAKIAGAN